MQTNSQILIAHASEEDRASFYRKTYSHVAMAILAFILVESLLLKLVPMDTILYMVSGKYVWLFILGAFWLASTLSGRLVFHPSIERQYLGLALFVIIEAIIFLPMIAIAVLYTGGDLIMQAAVITLFMFTGLTAVVFLTKKDFSFLRTAITIGGFVSLGLIVAGAIFGFDLGLWFSAGMVILASGTILYQTSQIKNQFHTHQYVGASLQLFSSIMLLFWYILRILMSRK